STITNNLPAGGLRIIGTASDSLSGVKQVYVSVDGGPFQPAQGTNNWTNQVYRVRETNIQIKAYAVDNAGNTSSTYSISVNVDRTYLGNGEYNFWASLIKDVYVKSSSGGGLVVDIVISNAANDDHNLYVLVDVTNMTTGHQPPPTGWCGDWYTGWGDFWFTNTAGINADFVVWGWIDNPFPRTLQQTNARKIVSGVTNSVSVSHTMTYISGADHIYSFTIPYASIGSGASSGQVVNIYVFYGLSGGTPGNQGMRSIFPAGVSVTASGGWGHYIVNVTNKSIDYVLNP
ncbi:MAG: hypothetical protein ABDH28_06830, partial [Brevinematia bacterium]